MVAEPFTGPRGERQERAMLDLYSVGAGSSVNVASNKVKESRVNFPTAFWLSNGAPQTLEYSRAQHLHLPVSILAYPPDPAILETVVLSFVPIISGESHPSHRHAAGSAHGRSVEMGIEPAGRLAVCGGYCQLRSKPHRE